MSKLSLILIAALAGSAASPAFAQDGDERPTATVRYDDLNLWTAAGRERLDTRVRMAIRSMCAVDPRPSLRQRAEGRECEAIAKRSVEPQVAALYNGSHARFASEKPPVVAAP